MDKNITEQLLQVVGKDNFSISTEDRNAHAKDMSFHKASLPDVVIWPKDAKQVSEVLKLAYLHAIPVTPWGGGSSLEGNPIPVKGGIVLNMTKMNRITNVHEEDLQVTVQPGIIGDVLNEQLVQYGLFFPAFPGSSNIATVGGMIANNAGGMQALKYGVVGNLVLRLQVVLADGDIIIVGNRSLKSVSGYDLKRLFIGSEGTLGVITEATLKLAPIPKSKVAVMATFDTVHDASEAVLSILKSDIEPASIEFMDKAYVGFVNKAKQSDLLESPTLLIELHGNKEVLLQKTKPLEKLCQNNNCSDYKEFISPEELRFAWEYRKAVRPAIRNLMPNSGVLSAEVGMPISRVGDFLQKAEEVSKEYDLPTVMFGHIGDGNFHGWALYTLNDAESWSKVSKLNDELVRFAISVGGTTTGEHGVGIGKRKFLPIEHSTSLPLMKSIKELFDKKGILNPGKVFPD